MPLHEALIRDSLEAHDRRNAALLADLRNRGVDVGRAHAVEHHFWAPDQRRGALLAQQLYQLGYLVLLLSPVEDEDGSVVWNVEASIQSTLADAASQRVAESLVRLSAEFDATYDGWGVTV
jgi:regulator of RNase E activity RraB